MRLVRDLRVMGAKLLAPTIFDDNRGYFYESYNRDSLKKFGIECDFLQDNHSFSKEGVVRGMHFHKDGIQAKLVRCPFGGGIYDVIVDLRKDSPTYKQWEGVYLNDNSHIIYVPPGCAHGFYALADSHVSYKSSTMYEPNAEMSFRYDDPEININWALKAGHPILSEKDLLAPDFKEIEEIL